MDVNCCWKHDVEVEVMFKQLSMMLNSQAPHFYYSWNFIEKCQKRFAGLLINYFLLLISYFNYSVSPDN